MELQETLTLGGSELILLGDAAPEALLLQPVDEHDRELLESEAAHIRAMAGERRFLLAALCVADWNRDLSPWSAPPVFGDAAFEGGAEATLRTLLTQILPPLEARFQPQIQVLGGYSLAGLFALWAGCQTDAFDALAAASPSVWFPGWDDYAQSHPFRARRVYLSLGDREERARNPVMARVGDAIREQYRRLQQAQIPSTLEWNPGNHFRDSDQRTARAFAWAMEK